MNSWKKASRKFDAVHPPAVIQEELTSGAANHRARENAFGDTWLRQSLRGVVRIHLRCHSSGHMKGERHVEPDETHRRATHSHCAEQRPSQKPG